MVLRQGDRYGLRSHTELVKRTVSRFTVSNTVFFLGQRYIVLWMPSLLGLLFFSLRRLFTSHQDVSILQSAFRQTKHWNDCSSNTTPTFAIQEALSPQTPSSLRKSNTNINLHNGTFTSLLYHQRYDRRRVGPLLCNVRFAVQLADASARKGAHHRETSINTNNVRTAGICS